MSRPDPLAPTPPPDQGQNLLSMPQGLRPPLTIHEHLANMLHDIQNGASSAASSVQSAGNTLFGGPYSTQDIVSGHNIIDSAANFSFPARIAINPNGSTAQKVVDLLKNTMPDPLAPIGKWDMKTSNVAALMDTIRNHFSREELPDVGKYLESINKWKAGHQATIRDAMKGIGDTLGNGTYNKNFGEMADRLHELFSTSDYSSKGPLYRLTGGMEIPSVGGPALANPRPNASFWGSPQPLPVPGQQFYLEPAPWTSSPKTAKTGQFASRRDFFPPLMMEPGAKTLPIGGVLGFPEEFEHITGGLMEVQSADKDAIRLRQISPVIGKRRGAKP